MILLALLLAQPGGYDPETEAIFRRRGQPLQGARRDEARAAGVNAALRAIVPPKQLARFSACIDQAAQDPEAAITSANAWLTDGGEVAARECLGIAYGRVANWSAAVTSFTAAAKAVERENPQAASRIWGQVGNAALAGGDVAAARTAFDTAIVAAVPNALATGELYLDRARARVAQSDLAGARSDLDVAIRLVPDDPLVWLLSATLARRMDDLDRAAQDIGQAVKRAGDDASVALESGVIAALSGQDDAARTAFARAKALDAAGPVGQAADAYLAQLPPQ